MTHFLQMGGYGAFVWPCFVLAGIVLTWNVLAARRLHAVAKERAIKRTSAGRILR